VTSLQDQILENLGDAVTVQDRDFNIVFQNRAIQRTFGSHIGEKCYEAYEHRCTVCEGCGPKTVFRTGQPVTVLRTAFEANGTTSFWENSCSPVFDESGRIFACAEVCRNVSDRVSLEEAFKATNIKLGQLTSHLELRVTERTAELARANRYLDEIIDSIADPLFVKDRLCRWVLVNRAMCEFLGHARGEILGRTDFDLFPEAEARIFRAFDELVLETGRENINEEQVTTAGAGTRTIVTKKACFSDPNGEKRIVGIIRDITERKRLEEQVRQSQKMESIGMLAGGIAHDFNNLLTPILGGSDLLLLDPDDAARVSLLHDMRQAADRLRELTQHLLAFGRKQVLELRQTDLGDVVRQFEHMLRRTLREDIRILIDIASEPHLVLADAGQIEQVLLNLAVNAQDAMPGGGALTIEVGSVQLDAEYSEGHPEVRPGAHVQLAVSDTGSGMNKQTQAHLFEPFFTTKGKGRGTGLGLSMVYGIVKQHGGSVGVYSEPGRGTTFKIYLPVVKADSPVDGDAVAAPAPPEARPKETILVLEDNDMVRNTACEMLRRLGYRVLAADGPDSCMSLARAHEGPIDLLLSDVILRESNGCEVYDRLRTERAGLKVLYMSGYTSNVVVHHGVLNESVHFLQKPLSFPALASKVRQVMDTV
jgi:PAS domain S-box-containing protein